MKPRHSQCACGAEIAQKLGPGRMRLKCEPCANPPRKPRLPSKGPRVKLGPQATVGSCLKCGVEFTYIRARGRKRRFCSPDCRDTYNQREHRSVECRHCGASFRPRRVNSASKGILSIFCSQACRGLSQRRPEQAAETRRRNAATRRARKRNAKIEDFTHLEVFERDGWKCGLCHKRVDRKLAFPHPMSASLDHIVPLCDGGEHSLRNVQCSHWICNSRKTFGAGGQMRLFG